MGFLATFMLKVGMNTDEVTKGLSRTRSDLASWSRDLTAIGQKLTASVTLPIVGVGVAALKTAGELEQNAVAFKTMLGSAQAATKHLNELKDFALKTPFQFNDLTIASKRLQALGFDAKQVIPMLTSIGDAASALGMGAEGIQRITTALGQMKAKGTVQAEEMRQLAEAGIPAWEILAKTLNTDVAGAMKLVEQRAVESGKAVPAILAGINEKFGGLMKEQSKTLLGQFSNLKDQITFTLQDLGKTLAPAAKNVMENVIQPVLVGVKEMAAQFAAMPPSMQQAIIGVTAFVAALGPLGLISGQVIGGLRDIIGLALKLPALLNPVTLAVAALGTGAAIAFYELNQATSKFGDMDKKYQAYISDMVGKTTDYAKARDVLKKAVDGGALSLTNYNQALQILNDREQKALGSEMQKQIEDWGIKVDTSLLKAKKRVEEVTEKFDKFRAMAFGERSGKGALDSALILNSAQSAGNEQAEIVKWIAEWNKNGGAAGWQQRMGAESMPTIGIQYDDSGSKGLLRDMQQLQGYFKGMPLDVATIDKALDSFGLAGDRANIPALERNFEVLGDAMESGAIDTDTYLKAWIRLVKAMDSMGKPLAPETKRMAIELEKQYGGQLGQTRKEMSALGREAERFYHAISRGIASSIVNFKGWGETFKNIAKDTAQGLLTIFVEAFFKKMAKELAGLLANSKGVLGSIGKWLGGLAGTGGSAASAAGGAASAAGSAGSAGAGAAGSAASGVMGTIGAVSAAVGAVSSIVGNFQMAGMNKSLDVLVNHTLRAYNELANFRQDAWTREGHLMLKLDDMWNEIRNVVGAVKGGTGGSGKGGLTFNNCSFNGTPQQNAAAIFQYADLAGAL